MPSFNSFPENGLLVFLTVQALAVLFLGMDPKTRLLNAALSALQWRCPSVTAKCKSMFGFQEKRLRRPAAGDLGTWEAWTSEAPQRALHLRCHREAAEPPGARLF